MDIALDDIRVLDLTESFWGRAAAAMLGLDASAVVAHTDGDGFGRATRLDAYGPDLTDGLERVDQEIHEDLAQLAARPPHGRDLAVRFLDAGGALAVGACDAHAGFEHLVHVDLVATVRAGVRELPHVPGDRDRALDALE